MKLAAALLVAVVSVALTSADVHVPAPHKGYIGKRPHTTQNEGCWQKCTHEKDHLGNKEVPSHVLSVCKEEFDDQDDVPAADWKGPMCQNALRDCAENCEFQWCQLLGDLAQNNHYLNCGSDTDSA